jgi:uncharacterized protein with PIN domain
MLFKLVKYLRNIGIDTEFCGEKDNKMLMDKALKEERIIITRDQKFFKTKK